MLELKARATSCQILWSTSDYPPPLISRKALFVGTNTKYQVVIDKCPDWSFLPSTDKEIENVDKDWNLLWNQIIEDTLI